MVAVLGRKDFLKQGEKGNEWLYERQREGQNKDDNAA